MLVDWRCDYPSFTTGAGCVKRPSRLRCSFAPLFAAKEQRSWDLGRPGIMRRWPSTSKARRPHRCRCPAAAALWVIVVLALGAIALGYALVNISTQKAGRAVVRVAGIADAQEIFGGVPQAGDRLGSSDAPVTIQVFNDLQCSSCRADFLRTIPGLVDDYARPGDAKLLYRHYSVSESPQELGFYGAEAAAAAGLRLAVHLPLLPQPGRGRSGSGSTRTSSTRSPAGSRSSTSRSGEPTSTTTAAPAGRSRSARGYEQARHRPRHPHPPGGDRERPERNPHPPGRPHARPDRGRDPGGAVIDPPSGIIARLSGRGAAW